jgi:hypothetical protein
VDKELLESLKLANSDIQRKLYFLGWLNRKLVDCGIKRLPILVGGSAVSAYTNGNYATKDIALIYNSDDLFTILTENDFIKDGRYFYNEKIDILLECPGSDFDSKSKIIRLKNSDIVRIISIEDLIIDRMCSVVHWEYKDDLEWVKYLITIKNIDKDYLLSKAKTEYVYDELVKLLKDIGGI